MSVMATVFFPGFCERVRIGRSNWCRACRSRIDDDFDKRPPKAK